VYQAGNDARLGLNFCLGYVPMLHPVKRITARKIYITFTIPLQSEADTFLQALNRRVRELVQEDHLDANRLHSSNDEKNQIVDVFDERNGTIRL